MSEYCETFQFSVYLGIEGFILNYECTQIMEEM